MQIDYLEYLPEEFRVSSLQLYFNALKEKLEPLLGSDSRAQEALASNLGTSKCLVAICNQKLIGILGIQAGNGGFVNPTLKTMVKVYGILGGLIRMGGLAILHHRTTPDELYVDGVAVADDMRGNGIGSRLFELLEKKATKNNIRKISLEVIDSNPRARALYERLGFVITKKQSIWPLNLFIKFTFRSATLMVKMMGQQTN